MVSVQEPCQIEFVAVAPSGARRQLLKADVGVLATGGGCADGALSGTTKMNERLFVPTKYSVPLRTDDIIQVIVTAAAADGVIAAECNFFVPLTMPDGSVKFVSRADFANPAAANWTTVAAIPTVMMGYRITEGLCYFGGGGIYADIQDDT